MLETEEVFKNQLMMLKDIKVIKKGLPFIVSLRQLVIK